MKRFHVHISVNDIDESVRFYSNVFGSEPSVQKPDYAKWMVEDPRINFAISARGAKPGINHLGLQVDSNEELESMREQLAAADAAFLQEKDAHCCYAQSDKYWITDPQGIAWETYHSLGSIPMFGARSDAADHASARGCGGDATMDDKPSGRGKIASSSCCS